jgi:hypothetical protein
MIQSYKIGPTMSSEKTILPLFFYGLGVVFGAGKFRVYKYERLKCMQLKDLREI